MIASNTPLLTLPLSRDSDQADSLCPKELILLGLAVWLARGFQ